MGRPRRDLDGFHRLVDLDSGEILLRCEEILQAIYRGIPRRTKNFIARPKKTTDICRVIGRLRLTAALPEVLASEGMRGVLAWRLAKHAQTCCTVISPKCNTCPLVSFCSFGIKRAAQSSSDKLAAIDLCAGSGGLSAGFRREGFHVVLAVEKDKHAAQSYRVNNPGVPVIEGDVRKIRPIQVLRALGLRRGQVTALIAGPPCQGFSVAGPRKPRATRNFLFQSIADIAKGLNVGIVVMENVPGLRRVGGVSFESRILKCFDRVGYAGKVTAVDASAFGVPQRRRRIIFVCARPRYNVNSFALRRLKSRTRPTVSLALRMLPPPTKGHREYERRVRGKCISNHRAMDHSAKVVRKIKQISRGKGPLSYRRLSSGLAHTLIAGHRAMPVHPRQHRTITVREAARLQTLPDTFRFLGPHSEQPLQVANVVPYLLSRAIARSLLTWISDSSRRIR